ncbi:SgcJ/EcaC family oxidoreductase [Actinomadura decatromicini]|uniref:SgcJ/EcaC family oxidoreductase n=1 Tax=Actinomadura decatromicini TaxID=2604572 RepID=A0A5D3F7N1_9ACTN|nr:SgcJ/EcaC family oxidoreductase [Actinomadura decatromicini]TYK45027.1 SgcJ/EcaC family oxidoreductase [Actinomadura decatromicini]
MTTHDPDTGAPYGAAARRDGRALLRLERRLRHPPERVWRALTDPAELSAWLADAELEPAVCGGFELRWLNAGDAEPAVARGTVTAFDPPRLLELDSDLHGVLRWELTPVPDGTHLVFTSHVEVPEEFVTRALAGWHLHLDYLDDALGGARVDWATWTTDRWRVHHDRYAALLGDLDAVRDLYRRVLDGWNARDGRAFADPFHDDGEAVGFDGTVHPGRERIAEQLDRIFAGHATARYVAVVRDVRVVGPGAAVLRAVAGMVPPGSADIDPAVNCVQTLTASKLMGRWRVALFQNTPAAYHGRPEEAAALTAELRAALRGEGAPGA